MEDKLRKFNHANLKRMNKKERDQVMKSEKCSQPLKQICSAVIFTRTPVLKRKSPKIEPKKVKS